MKRFFAILSVAALLLSSCDSKSRKMLLPGISGKAGEVLVVADKAVWEGDAGEALRQYLACDCPYLPQREPLYSLVNVLPSGFNDLFKVHRNILTVSVNAQYQSDTVRFLRDSWATPQCLVRIEARTQEAAKALVDANGPRIVNVIEQAERDRVVSNARRYEDKSIRAALCGIFGGGVHCPDGYVLRKKTEDFAWIQYEVQNATQAILVYKTPVGRDPFNVRNIIDTRNEVMMLNVPGMFDNTYMTTSSVLEPTTTFIKYKGREFAETRGFWEVQNDFMGGPFVSHSFYSPDGKEIITAEAFVYAAGLDKRQYLRQVESILYSWEWEEKSSEN